ncbi:MAG: hypothetical protein ISF22_11165 [Methanomassiliicoccus sp.]|nr:hypothetical protein [Methanomassiliicoccus sp.]
MRKLDRSDFVCVVAAAVLLYMTVLSILGTDRTGYQIWTGVLCAAVCLLPMLFRHAGIMTLPFTLVVLIAVAVFLHGYGVLLMRYDDLLWYDTMTHTVSTITVALCVFYSLMTVELLDLRTTFSPKWIPLFITMIVLTFSIYWEVMELIVDMIWNINMQYSPWDTIRDMAFNTVGVLVVTVSARLYLREHTSEEFIEGLELHPRLRDAVARHRPIKKRPVRVPHLAGVPDPMEASASGSFDDDHERNRH